MRPENQPWLSPNHSRFNFLHSDLRGMVFIKKAQLQTVHQHIFHERNLQHHDLCSIENHESMWILPYFAIFYEILLLSRLPVQTLKSSHHRIPWHPMTALSGHGSVESREFQELFRHRRALFLVSGLVQWWVFLPKKRLYIWWQKPWFIMVSCWFFHEFSEKKQSVDLGSKEKRGTKRDRTGFSHQWVYHKGQRVSTVIVFRWGLRVSIMFNKCCPRGS